MFKRIALIFTLFIGSTCWATHVSGGQIYWEALGNDRHIIRLELIKSSNSTVTLPNSAGISISGAATQYVSLARVGSLDTTAIFCRRSGLRQFEYLTYESSAITLTPLTSGQVYTFRYRTCCMPSSPLMNVATPDTLGIQLESTMYEDGVNRSSPRFFPEQLLFGSNERSVQLEYIIPAQQDGIVAFSHPLHYINDTISFLPGFDYQHPTSPTDTLTPNGLFTSGATDSASALVAFQIDAHFQNSPTSTVRYRSVFSFDSTSLTGQNPTMEFMSSTYSVANPDSNVYRYRPLTNHTSTIRFKAKNHDFTAGDVITVRVIGDALNQTSYNKPTWVPIIGYNMVSTDSIEFDFVWAVPQGITPGTYPFLVIIENNDCPYYGRTVVRIEAVVTGQERVDETMCRGDSVSLGKPTANVALLPLTDQSVQSDGFVYAVPDSSTQYYVISSGDTVRVIFIEVTEPIQPIVNTSNGRILFSNYYDFENNTLFYYYVPVNYDSTNYKPAYEGVFHLRAENENCTTTSDSIHLMSPGNYGFAIYNEFTPEYTYMTVGSTYSTRIEFKQGIQPSVLNEIIIPGGFGASQGRFRMWYTDTSGTRKFVLDRKHPNRAISFKIDPPLLITGNELFIEIEAIIGPVYFGQVSHASGILPETSELKVTSATFTNASGGSVNNSVMQMAFHGTSGITLPEQGDKSSVAVYPNPTNGQVRISSDLSNIEYRIVSLSGVVHLIGRVSSDAFIDLSGVDTGIYLLEWQSGKYSGVERIVRY